MRKIFNYLIVANVFLGGLVLVDSPFEFYLGYIFVLLFLPVYVFCYGKLSINRKFMNTLAILTAASLINVFLGNNTLHLLAKQFTGILITGLAYYLLFKVNDYEIEKLFRIYYIKK